ncbi:MAG: hypothetical protein LBK94_07130 [Prevotellaceae bacterium]|jgi:hypothetical protein|nr:hypothetical protein [Prevotellaceae bacterium]
MNGKEYNVQEFYLHLKLGIWQSGQVAGWGHVETAKVRSDLMTDKGFFIHKALNTYFHSPLIKKHLSSGLFLLDLYCLNKNTAEKYVHVAVVAVCRATVDYIKSVECLRIINQLDACKFLQLLQNPASVKTSGAYPKWKTAGAGGRINNGIPVYTRKH